MEVLGRPATVDESRRLGRAAVMAMLAIARSAPGAVLDSTFYPYAVPYLEQLPGTVIELRCRCPVKSRGRATGPGARPGTPGIWTTSAHRTSSGTGTTWSLSGSGR